MLSFADRVEVPTHVMVRFLDKESRVPESGNGTVLRTG